MDSQAKVFLLGVQHAVKLMHNGGRVIAVTYAPGSRAGTWQPWIAMGASKAELEAALASARKSSERLELAAQVAGAQDGFELGVGPAPDHTELRQGDRLLAVLAPEIPGTFRPVGIIVVGVGIDRHHSVPRRRSASAFHASRSSITMFSA